MSTTLEILAPYLPYGITVATPKGCAKLIGLNDGHFQCPAETLLVKDEEYSGILTGRYNWDYKEIAPVLRSFADLCTPLEDGTVPAVEVAKMQWPSMHGADKAIWMPSKTQGYVVDKYGCLLVYFTESFYNNDLSVKPFSYLRSKHFAVGLTAEQYTRKGA